MRDRGTPRKASGPPAIPSDDRFASFVPSWVVLNGTVSRSETCMSVVKSPLSDTDLKTVGDALQGALVDLLDLSLVAKQVHWNVVGPRFRSVHLQLDDVVDTARQHSDTVAERASAIGVNPDGRAATIARST